MLLTGFSLVAYTGRYSGTDSGNTVYGNGEGIFEQVKIEYGSTATGYTLAPEDTNYSIAMARTTAITTAETDAAEKYLPLTGGTITGNLAVNGTLDIGSARLTYDSTNNCIKLTKTDGTVCNFYSSGGVTALATS